MDTVPASSQPTAAPGARPTGVTSADEAAENIRQMFDTIAPTYDRANHLLSVGLDRGWWNRAARTLAPILARPEAVILDLCCGTGDMTMALDRLRPKHRVPHDRQGAAEPIVGSGTFGSNLQSAAADSPTSLHRSEANQSSPQPILAVDFSANMLALSQPKFAGRNIVTLQADALHLPLASSSVDLVTSAFGFRNLTDYAAGLAELHRILRPNGQIAILECNQPDGLTGALYSFYFHRILPVLGGLITGKRNAYAYLPDSVMKFPRPPQMKSLIAAAGFANPTWTSYTLGTVGLYRATKI
jgi:demethylmenaquinone methyltransferase/2-methoxy-6-polyprenyl-1,4-benzoquinol methylase